MIVTILKLSEGDIDFFCDGYLRYFFINIKRTQLMVLFAMPTIILDIVLGQMWDTMVQNI